MVACGENENENDRGVRLMFIRNEYLTLERDDYFEGQFGTVKEKAGGEKAAAGRSGTAIKFIFSGRSEWDRDQTQTESAESHAPPQTQTQTQTCDADALLKA